MDTYLIVISAILFISIDFIYLNIINSYFSNQIKNVQGTNPKINLFGAAVCYLFLLIGLNYFIIEPRKSCYEAFLLGIVIYGVYETTNYALLKDWSIFTVLMDTLWGGLLFAATTYIVNKLR